MNTQKIKFTANGTVKEIEVQNAYPYLENQATGKVVFVVQAKEEDATAADLEALADNDSGIIEYYVKPALFDGNGNPTGEFGDWELKETYDKYNSGEIRTSYQNGMRECRVTRIDGTVADVAKLRADVDFVALMTDVDLDA